MRCERGGAPTLAVFAIFVIISSMVAVESTQSSAQRSTNAIQQRTAADVARAAAASVETELNEYLVGAAASAMDEVGTGEGEWSERTMEKVENYIREYVNARIAQGWTRSNLDENIPLADESNLAFQWLPNGSVRMSGYLDAVIQHVEGPTVYGVNLNATCLARFERLRYISELVRRMLPGVELGAAREALAEELSDSYACEGIRIELYPEGGGKVVDEYAAWPF